MSSDQANERQSLMQKLLDSVKQCQVEFGGKTSLATDKDSCVLCLVNQFENAFQHGLKKNKILEKISSLTESIRQVTQKMLPEIEITFWSMIKEHLGPLDLQHYQTMEGVTSDSGRARVWLRTAINENMLEKSLNNILNNKELLRLHYEPWALLLDEERASTLPIMAQGLGSILFAIETKNPELNLPFKNIPPPTASVPAPMLNFNKTHRRINSMPLPVIAGFDTEPSILKKINTKKKKKRKVVQATINDLEEIPDTDNSYSSSYSGTSTYLLDDQNKVDSSDNISKSFSNTSNEPYIRSKQYIDSNQDSLHESKSAPVSPTFNLTNDVVESENADINPVSKSENNSELITNEKSSFGSSSVSSLSEQISNTTPSTTQEINTSTPSAMISIVHSETANHKLDETATSEDKLNLNTESHIELNKRDLQQENQNLIKQDDSSSTKNSAPFENEIKYSPMKDMSTDELTFSGSEHLNLDDCLVVSNTDIERSSVASSADSTQGDADSTTDELTDFMMPRVGSDASKYAQLFISYDQEASRAATDTLALLSATSPDNSSNLLFNIDQRDGGAGREEGGGKVEEEGNSLMDKFIPKIDHTSNEKGTSQDVDVKNQDMKASGLSAIDLKQAILATARKKDEVEQENSVLKTALEENRDQIKRLQAENEELHVALHNKDEQSKKKLSDMNREIEVLKNQLKRYVAAVQMLRNDKILSDEAKEAIGDLRVSSDDVSVPPKPKERTLSENDSIFEDKLAQMAEMHGELMEFQETLQRQLVSKDLLISRMKQELIVLRGPLPDNGGGEGSSLQSSSESLYTAVRLLINIWIPSVFLKGKGTDAFHLYQVYIHIGDEEWNIYRRYSQFNKLHSQMCKAYPSLEKFDFPKKKMFGKKDLKFVEERRHKLQEYLRIVINTLISNHTELSTNSSKQQLVKVIPFFSEQFGNQDDKKKNSKTKKSNSKEAPKYTGLTSFPEVHNFHGT